MSFRIHELKLLYTFQSSILSGAKQFEVRKNDRDYQVGDLIKFHIVNRIKATEPIEDYLYRITYILSGWHIEEGYVVLGIQPAVYLRGR